jgi:hypothetical protein
MPVVYSIVVVMLGKLGDGLGEGDMGWDPRGLNASMTAAGLLATGR